MPQETPGKISTGLLRPRFTHSLEGPGIFAVEAVIPQQRLDTQAVDDLWVRDAGWTGVRVDETPLSRCLQPQVYGAPMRAVLVQVAIDPHTEIHFSGVEAP